MQHTMKLRDVPFDQIKNGEKTIELRLYDEKRRLLAPGDTICFIRETAPEETLLVQVTVLHRFPSFRELFRHLPSSSCGFEDYTTAPEEVMYAYYSPEKEREYGVVGIEFMRLF